MITLICPTRSRPDKMRRMWQSALKTAHDASQLRLVIGIDEDEQHLYGPVISEGITAYLLKDYGIVHGFNAIINVLMLEEKHKIFVAAPDDVIFATPHWDKALLDSYNALENKAHVFCFRDSRDINGTPHPIITREYIEVLGYAYPPIFLHWYVDTWTAHIAKECGIFTHLLDYELIHDKPSDQGLYDTTHKRPRLRGWRERDHFVSDTCGHFLASEVARMKEALKCQS